MTSEPMPSVFFDGACPLCAREIAFYRRHRGASEIAWVDVSRTDVADLPNGLSRQDALARFRVQTADGNLVDGAAAFAQLWSVLPRFRLMGKVAQPPRFSGFSNVSTTCLCPCAPTCRGWSRDGTRRIAKHPEQ